MKKFSFAALLTFMFLMLATPAFAASLQKDIVTAKDGAGVPTAIYGFGPSFAGAEGRFVATGEIEKDTDHFQIEWDQVGLYDVSNGGVIHPGPTVGSGDPYATPAVGVSGVAPTTVDHYVVSIYSGWNNSPKNKTGMTAAAAAQSATSTDVNVPQGVSLVEYSNAAVPGTELDVPFASLATPGAENGNLVIGIKAVDSNGNWSPEYYSYYLKTNSEQTASKTGIKYAVKANMYNNTVDTSIMDRAWKKQKTHGNYQYNTNSCAGCHKFHSGNGEMLLFANTEEALCESCHDGTVGGSNITMADQNAGVFNHNVTHNIGDGTSQHDIATTNLSAAPGGNDQVGSETHGWGVALQCSSCHNPHGPTGNPHGNDGGFLLRYDNAGIDDNGLNLNGLIATDSIPVVSGVSNSKDADTGLYAKIENSNWVYVGSNTSKTLKPYVWVNDKIGYVQVTPVVSGTIAVTETDANISGSAIGATGVLTASANNAGLTNPLKSVAAAKHITGLVVSYDVQPFVQADTKTDNNSYWNDKDANYVAGSGQALTLFCVQCHTDYLSGTRKDSSGQYDHSMRHKTMGDTLSCTRCHFAHGTSKDVMRDAKGYSAKEIFDGVAGAPTVDTNGVTMTGDQAKADGYIIDSGLDPANKRFTGFSVCLQCHADAALGNGATVVGWSGQSLYDVGSHIQSLPY